MYVLRGTLAKGVFPVHLFCKKKYVDFVNLYVQHLSAQNKVREHVVTISLATSMTGTNHFKWLALNRYVGRAAVKQEMGH